MEGTGTALTATLDFMRSLFQPSTLFCVFFIDITAEKAEKILRINEIIELFTQRTELYSFFSVYFFNKTPDPLIPIEDLSKKVFHLSKSDSKAVMPNTISCYLTLTELLKDFGKLTWRNKESKRANFRIFTFTDTENPIETSSEVLSNIKTISNEIFHESYDLGYHIFGLNVDPTNNPVNFGLERHLVHCEAYNIKNISLIMKDVTQLIELDKIVRGAETNICDIFNEHILCTEVYEYAEELDKIEKKAGKVLMEIEQNYVTACSENSNARLLDENRRKDFLLEILRIRQEFEHEVVRKLEKLRERAWKKLQSSPEKIEEEFKRISNINVAKQSRAYQLRILKLWARATDELEQIRSEIRKKEGFFDEKSEKITKVESRYLFADNAGNYLV